MIQIREFIMSGGGATDDAALVQMIANRMPAAVPANQLAWLQQVELMLDGYGSPSQLQAIERVKAAIKVIKLEIASAPAAG